MSRISLQIGALFWFLLSFLTSSASASLPGQASCNNVKWYESGAAKQSGTWLQTIGVRGKNIITRPSLDLVYDSGRYWVNSDWVKQADNNWIELGWHTSQTESGGQVWQLLVWRQRPGQDAERLENPPPPITPDHTYQFILRKGEQENLWRYKVVDRDTGVTIYAKTWDALVLQGTVGVQQERHNDCYNGETDWMDLQYWSGTSWPYWPSIADAELPSQDDPEYYSYIDQAGHDFLVRQIP